MRPVRRGTPVIFADGRPYGKAMNDLLAKLGPYCSYCERRLPSGAEVEHIEAKSQYPDKERTWNNFLISCKNCNSCKRQHLALSVDQWLIPDRDNTAYAFVYREDGRVIESGVSVSVDLLAGKTLEVLGLNNEKNLSRSLPDQRKQARLQAELWLTRWMEFSPSVKEKMAELLVGHAKSEGFFSVWMAVFQKVPEVRIELLKAFPGTERACFDPVTTAPITPHPNTDGLAHGGKC
ncbi:MAG: HNH endonuclease [Magnetococcales bacterium]|nr:HNH endonuclease [Magnetococcales bacterium]